MLVIRLARIGRRNAPKYRIVIQEKSQAPKAAAKEILGSYDPSLPERKDQIQLDTERTKYWLSVGAQPSNTMHNMLIELGVIEGEKRRSVQPKKKEGEGEESGDAPAEAPAEGGEEKPADEKTEEAAQEEKPEEEKKEE